MPSRAGGGRTSVPWGGRSLALSALVHGTAIAAALGLLQVQRGRAGRPTRVASFHLEHGPSADRARHRPPEPASVPELPPAPAEPQLVEAIIEPPPWVVAELLEEVPLRDPLLDVAAFKRQPEEAPETQPEAEPQLEPAPAPAVAVEDEPEAPPAELSGDDLPEVLEGPLPRYPRQALRMQWQGTVRLRIRVDAAGRVLGVEVVESSGYAVLDEAAVEAFERWVFAPRLAGDPEVRVLAKPFTFRIR